MKTIRILSIICKRVRRSLSFVLFAFGTGALATHLVVCALAWHPLHALLAGVAVLFLAFEGYGLKRSLKNARL